MTEEQKRQLEWAIVGVVVVSTIAGTILLLHIFNSLRGLGGGFVGNFLPTPPGPLKDV